MTEGPLEQAVRDSEGLEKESYNDSVSVQNESANETMEWEHNLSDIDIELGKTVLQKDYFFKYLQDMNVDDYVDAANEDKFISTLKQIRSLILSFKCGVCGKNIKITKEKFVGSVFHVAYQCTSGHKFTWASSETLNNIYSVNFQFAVALILSGGMFLKHSLFCRFLKLRHISESTFYRINRLYIAPKVEWWWQSMQSELLNLYRGTKISVGGDGRNDSPGHSATYCMYTFMELASSYIIHQELVDVREVQLKSPNMEKLGCQRGLDYLLNQLGSLKGFVTDDHPQISAMLNKLFFANN